MKLYLAGPMRGYAEFNHPAFHEAAALLRSAGHEVFSPAEHDVSVGLDGAGKLGTDAELEASGTSLRYLLGVDLAWITAHADALVVLPGWEASIGVAAETATARALGLPVWEVGPFLTHDANAPVVTS